MSVVSAASLTVGAGQPLGATGDVLLATFSDANPQATSADYTATLTFDDGQTEAGVVVVNAPSDVEVYGNHTFADAGSHVIQVTLSDDGGQQATADASVTVSVPEGQPYSAALVVTLPGGANLSPGAAYGGSIDWGDGSGSSPATVTPLAAGSNQVLVTAVHTFTEESATPYTVTATVTDPGGLQAQASAAVPVSDAVLDGSGLDFTSTAGATFSGTVADLLDANAYATAQDFTATIDWGDNQQSAGTVSGSGGVFTFSGSHPYAAAGSYTVTVTITDDGGGQQCQRNRRL